MYGGGLLEVVDTQGRHSYILGHRLNGEGDFRIKYLIYLFS